MSEGFRVRAARGANRTIPGGRPQVPATAPRHRQYRFLVAVNSAFQLFGVHIR